MTVKALIAVLIAYGVRRCCKLYPSKSTSLEWDFGRLRPQGICNRKWYGIIILLRHCEECIARRGNLAYLSAGRNTTSNPSYAARRGWGSEASSSACVPCSVRAICVRYTAWSVGGVYRLVRVSTFTIL